MSKKIDILAVITITEAFFHPLSIVYLSEFYRVKEMGMRLSWLAGVQVCHGVLDLP